MTDKSQSPFRFVFWGLVVLQGLGFLGLIGPVMIGFFHSSGVGTPMFGFAHPFGVPMFRLVPLLLFFVFYVGVVGTLVYRDALQRGMDPWLWATVAVFVPLLIGVVIYLIVRAEAGAKCTNCGRQLQRGFRICPYCGHHQELRCPQCRAPVAADWNLCPQCGQSLKQPGGTPVDQAPGGEAPQS